MGNTAQERRTSRRHRVQLTAHCRIGHRFVRDPIGDLSSDGLYLRTREPVRLGAPVRVALVLPGSNGPEFCTLAGKVTRLDQRGAEGGSGVAVRFEPDQIAEADRALLEAYLRKSETEH